MWSFSRGRCGSIAPLLTALTLPSFLSGCFTPLYNESEHPGLVAEMRAIEVMPIADRFGHYLGSDLITDLNGTGSTPTPKYRLAVKISQSAQTPTVESQINAADAATVSATASFSLVQIDTGAVIVGGDATTAAVYDRTPQRFADLRAQRDVELRLSRALASEIEVRIAAALADKP
jgi:LPS-assembly lipoprotein